MASIVISGDTSGSISLAVPAVAGSNTITLPASTGTMVLTSNLQEIGVGQTWQSLAGSRTDGTTYTNSTGKPIFVSITGARGTNQGMSLTIDGVIVSWSGWYSLAGGQVVGTISGIVPNGGTYVTSGWSNGSLNSSWNELR
jgi:hypothetical protein